MLDASSSRFLTSTSSRMLGSTSPLGETESFGLLPTLSRRRCLALVSAASSSRPDTEAVVCDAATVYLALRRTEHALISDAELEARLCDALEDRVLHLSEEERHRCDGVWGTSPATTLESPTGADIFDSFVSSCALRAASRARGSKRLSTNFCCQAQRNRPFASPQRPVPRSRGPG